MDISNRTLKKISLILCLMLFMSFFSMITVYAQKAEQPTSVATESLGIEAPAEEHQQTLSNGVNTVADWEKIAAYGFGGVFVIALLVLAVKFPHPTAFQLGVFRTVLALACAGVAAMIPGFLSLNLDATGILLRAGGALAVFVLVYRVNPAVFVAGGTGPTQNP